jgi:two-component system sensor histidine kinase DesK
MRERINALGGSLQIDSPARKGTTLTVRVPLRNADVVEAAPLVVAPRSAA